MSDKKTQASNRMEYIDYVKGLCIVLLIVSHCIPQTSFGKTWISSFDMPIFFVVSGIIHAHRNNTGFNKTELYRLVRRRMRQIIIPYFVFGFVMICYYQGTSLLAGEGGWNKAKEGLFLLLTMQGIDSMWFLPPFLLAELFTVMFSLKRRKGVLPVIIGIMVGIVVLSYVGMPSQRYVRFIIKTAIGIIFMYLGIIVERTGIVEKLSGVAIFIMLVIGSATAQVNGFVGIGALELGNGMLFFLNAAIMCISFLALGKRAEKVDWRKLGVLSYYGQNTIVIVCTNNLLIEIIRLLDYKLTGDFLINSGAFGVAVMSLMICCLEALLIKFFSGRFGVLFGKKC